MKKKKEKLFGDMSMSEIEKWEKETNSIVLLDNERGIAFQKCRGFDLALAIIVDGVKPFLFVEEQIINIKKFLNKNF
jgi:hypothetical protein